MDKYLTEIIVLFLKKYITCLYRIIIKNFEKIYFIIKQK